MRLERIQKLEQPFIDSADQVSARNWRQSVRIARRHLTFPESLVGHVRGNKLRINVFSKRPLGSNAFRIALNFS